MTYFGCAAILQITVSLLLGITIGCSIAAAYHDYGWVNELESVKGVFSNEELELLRRNGHLWDIYYLIILLIFETGVVLHLVLSFCKHTEKFHKTKFAVIFIYFVGIGLIVLTLHPLLVAFKQDNTYDEIESKDYRSYVTRTILKNGSSFDQPGYSVFHYCRYAKGRPHRWSELKGIRMKFYGSKICQKIGLRLISSFLLLFSGILYLSIIKVLETRRRDTNAEFVGFIFDMFGDLEEAEAEAAGSIPWDKSTDLEEYKRKIAAYSYQNTVIPPKIKKWIETGKYDEVPADAYDEFEIPQAVEYLVSPFPDENKDLPPHIQKIIKMRTTAAEQAQLAEELEEYKESQRRRWNQERANQIEREKSTKGRIRLNVTQL